MQFIFHWNVFNISIIFSRCSCGEKIICGMNQENQLQGNSDQCIPREVSANALYLNRNTHISQEPSDKPFILESIKEHGCTEIFFDTHDISIYSAKQKKKLIPLSTAKIFMYFECQAKYVH